MELEESISDPSLIDDATGKIRWADALKSLQQSTGLIEDKEFAAYLTMSASSVSELLGGKVEPNPRIKLMILNHLGFYKIQSALYFLIKDEHVASLQRATKRQAKKIATTNADRSNKNAAEEQSE
ncbi:hypothetical protein HQ393_11325 [Chitinibacter bivalviorum]|uniref:Uncharacterized protein n=1 Tax=Chitinibacter bivalviorum TaxID=2739434 RepID=A0A7H9BJD3_9NEIS|nr:hypothetical protein [Chitinibacter bivalviorum]QLG88775.1 hypothetical protein HQ393_11325 [Chitinibacter bivalviorum]